MEQTVFFTLSITNYHNGEKEFDIYRIKNLSNELGAERKNAASKRRTNIIEFRKPDINKLPRVHVR